MNPKKLTFLLVAICFCCITNAQSIGLGLGGNMVVNTEGGNRLELSFYNDKGVDIVSITDWYKNLTDNNIQFSSLANSISTFKSEFRVLQTKYEQWVSTAKTNNVKEVEKELPCQISYTNCYCSAYSYPTKVIIKPYFVVRNYAPCCEIRIWQYFYDRVPNYNVWYLTPKDIPFLISAIEKGFQEHKIQSTKKQQTEDLFK